MQYLTSKNLLILLAIIIVGVIGYKFYNTSNELAQSTGIPLGTIMKIVGLIIIAGVGSLLLPSKSN